MKLTKKELEEIGSAVNELRKIWIANHPYMQPFDSLDGSWRQVLALLAKQVIDKRPAVGLSGKTQDSPKTAEQFYREQMGWGETDYLAEQCINPSDLFELMDAYADQKYGR